MDSSSRRIYFLYSPFLKPMRSLIQSLGVKLGMIPLKKIVAQNKDILISITSETINQMLSIPQSDSLRHFSQAAHMDLYQKLTFSQRAQIFKTFLPDDAELLKNNPPYPSTMFPEETRHIISLIACFLGYQNDRTVDESILGYFPFFPKTDNQHSCKITASSQLIICMNR